MAREFGLGRGLSSLIPNKPMASGAFSQAHQQRQTDQAEDQSPAVNQHNQVLEVSIGQIEANPHQPRTRFDEEKLFDLTESIKVHGILQPLVVSRAGGKYEIIAGERRFLAAQKAGLTKVPVIVRDAGEKEKLELAIIENTQRHDLNAVEEAKGYKKLEEEFQMTQEEVAHKVGKSRSVVANKVRLLSLPIEVQKALIEGKITEGHAKVLLGIENQEKLRGLFELILKQNLTVRQTEDRTRDVSVRPHMRTTNLDPEIRTLEDQLTSAIGAKVKISKSKTGGRVMIDYYSPDELQALIERLSAKQ